MDFKLTAEQLELQKVARDFAQKELTALADEMEESANPVPKDVLKKIGELGFLGINTPTEYGGLGLSNLDAIIVLEEFGKISSAVGWPVFEANAGPVKVIEHFGSDALKKRVIPLAEKLNSKITFSCNVEEKEDVIKLFKDVKSHWNEIDFVVHAVAFSDKAELSGEYLNTTRENFLRSMLISCFSFTEVSKEASKIMKDGGSLLTLTYESSKAIPNYNVMGVCKSALEASVKYLARDLGKKKIRVNAISAGPIKTLAASAIGDAKFLYKWNEDHSFLKRNVDIHDVGNSALYLLSELANGVTGEIHYVDAGYNKVGMPDPKNIS